MSDLRDWVAARAAHDLLRARLQRSFAITNPGAGADFTFTVPGGVYWELLAISATLTTSAVVANRFTSLRFTSNAGIWAVLGGATAIPASQAARVLWSLDIGDHVGGSFPAGLFEPLPAAYLLPGDIVTETTLSLDVGDQWSAIVVTVREWSAAQVGQHLEKILGDEMFATYADREV